MQICILNNSCHTQQRNISIQIHNTDDPPRKRLTNIMTPTGLTYIMHMKHRSYAWGWSYHGIYYKCSMSPRGPERHAYSVYARSSCARDAIGSGLQHPGFDREVCERPVNAGPSARPSLCCHSVAAPYLWPEDARGGTFNCNHLLSDRRFSLSLSRRLTNTWDLQTTRARRGVMACTRL